MKTRFLIAAYALLMMSVAASVAAPYVILPSGKKVTGVSVTAKDDGTILLKTETSTLTFAKGTAIVHVDKPTEYTRAVQFMQQGQYDQAIDMLRKVEKDYRFLQWDKQARAMMGGVYFKQGQFNRAVEVFDQVQQESPDALENEDVRFMYLEALLKSEAYDKVLPLLSDTIAKGTRDAAARAQMLRGDLELDRGELENALYDYMRTAEFFQDVKEWQAEATFKTAQCLEKLGDERAHEFYAKVVNDFGDSRFAAQARAKLN